MINFKGSYIINIPLTSMFMNNMLQVKHTNIITLMGESFFLNRAINDNFKPIQYIVLGNSSNRPQKTDLQLGNETSRRKCEKKVNLDKKRLELSATFQAREIQGTTEIGVANDDILISHDVYSKSEINDLLTPTTGDITIDYYLELSSGAIHNRDWTLAPDMTHVYYITEPNSVVGLFENNTGSGYVNNKQLTGLDNKPGSFYYDDSTRNLYVHTFQSINPGNVDLIILTR